MTAQESVGLNDGGRDEWVLVREYMPYPRKLHSDWAVIMPVEETQA